MKYSFSLVFLLSLLIFPACSQISMETETETGTDEESITIIESTLQGDYVNEEYGYALDLPEGHTAHTSGYDNEAAEKNTGNDTVWFGPDSDYWTEGFYIRILNTDLEAAYNDTLTFAKENCVTEPYPGTECMPLAYSENSQIIGGVEAKSITYGVAIGYEITNYYLEANGVVFEIQASSLNPSTDSIESLRFE